MNFSTILAKKQTIAVVVTIFLLLATIGTFLQPITFNSSSKMLVVQKFPDGTDPYTLSRSSSYLSSIISEVVATNAFYDQVASGGFGIDRRYFEKNPAPDKVTASWNKTVSTKTIGDTGIIVLKVVHPKKDQAEKIALGIHEKVIQTHTLFHGSGKLVSVKVIDSPIVSQATPNAKMNFAGALLLGFVASFAYIGLFPGRENELRFNRKERKESKELMKKSKKRKSDPLVIESMKQIVTAEGK